jgi:hypothetical protein
MEYQGNLLKMTAVNTVPVRYTLKLGGQAVEMNPLAGSLLRIEYLHRIHCIRCGNATRTSFAQGYCYPCFISAPETEDCVLRPEMCRAHLGESRDMEYARGHCLIDHYVYLAVSSGLKVGVTRHSQVPTRWIDQGAWQALRLAKTPNRYLAGCIEVALKAHYQDKTNWREMLMKDEPVETDLVKEKTRAAQFLHPDFQQYILDDNEVTRIKYPVLAYPPKVKPINLDKSDVLEGRLMGIKGQYLIFEGGMVINIRKYGGYLVRITRL